MIELLGSSSPAPTPRNRGLTAWELLVVIVIIGGTVLVFLHVASTARAQAHKAQGDQGLVASAAGVWDRRWGFDDCGGRGGRLTDGAQ